MDPNIQNTNQQVAEATIPFIQTPEKKSHKWIWIFITVIIFIAILIFVYFYFSTDLLKAKSNKKTELISPKIIQENFEDSIQKETEALDFGNLEKDLQDIETDVNSLK